MALFFSSFHFLVHIIILSWILQIYTQEVVEAATILNQNNAKFDYDDPTACILSSSPCDASRSCFGSIYDDKKCLVAAIPFRSSYSKVTCCFKCCYEYFLSNYKLTGDKVKGTVTKSTAQSAIPYDIYLPANLTLPSLYHDPASVSTSSTPPTSSSPSSTINSFFSLTNGMKSSASANTPPPPHLANTYTVHVRQPNFTRIITGLQSALDISTHIIPDHRFPTSSGMTGSLGNVSVMQVTTIVSSTSVSWRRILGRRITLLSPVRECMELPDAVNAMSMMAPMNNPRVSAWFTSQLPCKWANGQRSKTSAKQQQKQQRQQQRSKDISQSVEDFPLKSEFLRSNPLFQSAMTLMPLGARNADLFAQTMRDYGSSNELISDNERILIDCSCAASSSQYGKELATLLFSQGLSMCRPQSSPSSTTATTTYPNSILSTSDDNDKLGLYYKKLPHVLFVLSPSTVSSLSHCEWEAIAAGAIPLVSSSIIESDAILRELYDESLPMISVQNWKNVNEEYLRSSYAAMKQKMTTYSVAKAYFPYWLNSITNTLITGKPPSRFFVDIPAALSKNAPLCEAHDGHAGTPPVDFEDVVASASPGVFGVMKGRAIAIQSKKKIVAMNESQASMTGTSYVATSMASKKTGGRAGKSNIYHSLATSLGIETFKMEVVVPRCCEEGVETSWIASLLDATEHLHVSIYYKCPSCLPKSLATTWLSTLPKHLFGRMPKGVRLIDDSELLAYTGRVKQLSNFDIKYNGKEVSAYLQHILTRYDTLADQTIFLHTVPHAHIFFTLLFRTIRWAEHCKREIKFLHLNSNYKYGQWGACCGKHGACRISTHSWVFDGKSFDLSSATSLQRNRDQLHDRGGLSVANPYSGLSDGKAITINVTHPSFSVSTYSSAQFTASKTAIRSRPKAFWERMRMVINGSHDLDGCLASSEPDNPSWGGHSLTGQYERMWHMILGNYPPVQPKREIDFSLPKYFRQDCQYDQCKGAV